MEEEHTFVGKVFNYDHTKFQKGWSNIAVVGAHGRLQSQSYVKSHLPNTHICYL